MVYRRLFVAFALCFAVLSANISSAKAEAPSIAVVDAERVLSEAKAAQSLQKQLQSKKESFQKEFSSKEKQLKETEKSLLEEREKLSAEDFAKKRKAYEEKIIETRKLFQKTRNSLDQGLAKAMIELRRNIAEAAAKVADEKGYDVVLTKDSVLIAEKSLDITDAVLKSLNAQVSTISLSVE